MIKHCDYRYLKLDNANLYTGHSFRRTSATLLADSGANITAIKRHGGWLSDKVAEGYIEESVGNKRKIGKMITSSIQLNSIESNENSGQGQVAKNPQLETVTSKIHDEITTEKMFDVKKPVSVVLSNCTNCNVTFK